MTEKNFSFKLDRTAFSHTSLEKAGNDREYWLSQPPEERFRAAWYLTAQAWGFDPDDPPKMDKTHFEIVHRK